MKLSNLTAKLTSGSKSHAPRFLAAATLAGALLTVATPAAQAQHFGIGVVIGGPRYYAPPPPPPRYWGPRPYELGYGYHPYGYDRRDYFDHDRYARERWERDHHDRDRRDYDRHDRDDRWHR